MKKIKNKIATLVLILAALSFQGCNFLNVDSYFLDTLNVDSIFGNKVNAERYLWNTPKYFPDAGAIWGAPYCPGELASDEITARWKTWQFPGILFTMGEVNSRSLGTMNIWSNMYKTIAQCNEMLANVDKVPDMGVIEKQQYISYVHFMRGYAYYLLLQNWGPILIVGDAVIPNDRPAEEYNNTRSTYDASVEYICKEFAEAAKFLPTKANTALVNFGRPTKGAALAFIARLRLQHASPLYNGGDAAHQYFANWKTASGENYIQQTYNPKRWAVAAEACEKVMNLGEYGLHTVAANKLTPPLAVGVPTAKFPDGAGGIDPLHSYKDMFDGETLPQFNPELIWGQESSSNVGQYIRHSFSVYYGGYGGMSIPHSITTNFNMANGLSTEEAAQLPTTDDYHYEVDPAILAWKVKKADGTKKYPSKTEFSGYTLKSSGVSAMYFNREMRFYANIGFSGRFWPMTSATKNGQHDMQVQYGADSKGGKSGAGDNIKDYTSTGYVPVKYIHPNDAFKDDDGNNRTISKSYPTLRYAEILLAYVEALNNIDGSVTIEVPDDFDDAKTVTKTYARDMTKMQTYFNMVRFRSGLPGLTAAEVGDKAKMFDLIKRERLVEFFNENIRFYDIRRWGIYMTEDAKGWDGLRVEENIGNGSGPFYAIGNIDEQVVRDRITDKKMVWLPLPHDELLKVPAMDQNPGWER